MSRNWTYTYKTSDGLNHEGEISAPSKDDAYARLREKGIRPIRVTERIVPVIRRGFAGLRKRDWLVISLGAAAVALGALAYGLLGGGDGARQPKLASASDWVATSSPRKWFAISDAEIKGAFTHEVERWLAKYARPGVAPSESDAVVPGWADGGDASVFEVPVVVTASDANSVIQLKRIVAGMKAEALLALRNGQPLSKYLAFVIERQKMECEWRRSIEAQLQQGKIEPATVAEQLLVMGFEPLSGKMEKVSGPR